jgi:hypothetical protein
MAELVPVRDLEFPFLTEADLCKAIWTQLGLAYAVHKSLIFIRIPLAGAILPKVARTMRGWGYNVGRAPKPKPK